MSARVLKMKSYLFLRRCYNAVAAAAASESAAVLKMVPTAPETGEVINKIVKSTKEISWMREPKTGNWMPEDRFQEIDPAQLRAQLLNSKK